MGLNLVMAMLTDLHIHQAIAVDSPAPARTVTVDRPVLAETRTVDSPAPAQTQKSRKVDSFPNTQD